MARVFLYNVNDEEKRIKIQLAALRCGLKSVVVPPEDFSLPVGTYSIKAVNMPKDPDGYNVTRTVTKNGIIAEGSTIVRVGTAIFGHRDYSQQ